MGVLLVTFGGLGLLAALFLLITGSFRAAMWLGGAVGLLGFLASTATFALPRSAFGELGHGDGMGLIGLFIVGAILAGLGLVVAVIAGAKGGAKT